MEDKKWYETYIQVRTPEKERISRILTEKKGVERKAADYAAAVDITPAMMSRIINGNYAKPLAIDVLVKLAEGDDEVLKALLSANGMLSPEEQVRRYGRDRMRDRHMQMMDRERSMQNTVFSELFSKGVPMKRIPINSYMHGAGNSEEASKFFQLRIPTRFGIEMQGDDPYEWYFIINPSTFDDDDINDPAKIEEELMWNARRMIDRFAVIFLRDAWEPESLRDKKISFVFAEPKIYETFLSIMKDAKLHNRMSAVLVDFEADKVQEETSLVCSDFQDMSSPFSAEPVDSENNEEKNGFYYFFFDDDKKEGNE